MGNNATVMYEHGDDLDKLSRGFVLVCVVVQLIVCVVGSAGNLLTITAVIFTKALHKTYNAYILHLAFIDLTICVVFIPTNIQGLLHEGVIPANCDVIGAISLIALLLSILSLMMIGINRYILICKTSDVYDKIYNRKSIMFTFMFMWLWALVIVLPMHAVRGFGWNIKYHYCFFVAYDFQTYLYVTFGIALIGNVGSSTITVICYIMIIKKLKESARRIEPSARNTNNPVMQTTSSKNTNQKARKFDGSNKEVLAAATDMIQQQREKKEAKRRANNRRIMGLISIFIIFVICWMPIAVSFIIDYRQQVPGWAHVLFTTIAWVNSSVNVFLYALTSQKYRYSFKCILTFKFSELNRRRI